MKELEVEFRVQTVNSMKYLGVYSIFLKYIWPDS